MPYPRGEEEVEMLVQKGLVLLVPSAELLEKLVGVSQNLHHLHIALSMEGKRSLVQEEKAEKFNPRTVTTVL